MENRKGEKVSDFVGILAEVQSFYSNLFKKEGVDQESVDRVLSAVGVKISEEDKQMCDSDISVNEIKVAIEQTKNDKSPGLDGLTNEFDKAFSDILAPILWKVLYGREEGDA